MIRAFAAVGGGSGSWRHSKLQQKKGQLSFAMKPRTSIIAAALILPHGPLLHADSELLSPVEEGSFTVVIVPDTQHYRGSDTKIAEHKHQLFAGQKGEAYLGDHLRWAATQTFPDDRVTNPYLERHVDWILKNLAAQRIVFVSHVGDVVEKNRIEEWKVAASHLDRLRGQVPFAISVGNHDMENNGDASLFQESFPAKSFAGEDWYLESFDHERPERHVSRDNVNSVQIFSAGGIDFLFLHLECNAPDDVLDWANRIIREHPDREVLITTHMDLGVREKPATQEGFIRNRKGRMRWSKIHKERGNSAEQMWEKCYRHHPKLRFIFSGDQSRVTALRRDAVSDHGQTVHSLLSDYHSLGALRLVRFLPAKQRVDVITYDTMLEKTVDETWLTPDTSSHHFSLPWPVAVEPALPTTEAEVKKAGSVEQSPFRWLAFLMPWALLFIAILRDDLKDLLLRPKLTLDIPEHARGGDRTFLKAAAGTGSTAAVYFHVRARNACKWRKAEDCLLVVKRYKFLTNDGGKFETRMDDLAIKQRHHDERNPVDIGYNHVYYDLFRVTEDGRFKILLAPPIPNNVPLEFSGPVDIEIELAAVSVTSESPRKTVSIRWDGKFPKGDISENVIITIN